MYLGYFILLFYFPTIITADWFEAFIYEEPDYNGKWEYVQGENCVNLNHSPGGWVQVRSVKPRQTCVALFTRWNCKSSGATYLQAGQENPYNRDLQYGHKELKSIGHCAPHL